METGIQVLSDGITKRLEGMIDRSRSVSSYLNTVLLRKFQKAQVERFQTENSSEGSSWKKLSASYATRKRKIYASYPGGGNVTMIRTGALSSGAQARDSGKFYKLVTDRSFILGINLEAVPYAVYAGATRPFMKFSPERMKEWKQGIRSYITKNGGGG